MQKRLTSRTAILTHFTCPYKRFLLFHEKGSGLITEKTSLDLLIGIVTHRGLQHLLEHCRTEHPNGDFEDACVDEAVEKAYEIWRETLANKNLWLHYGEEDRLDWIVAEQECLFEGLIRAWAIRRLPSLLEEYTILEVEHEEVFEDFSDIITFLGKADYSALRKIDNKIIVGSFKTASQYAEVTTRDILHDMQGVSEWVIIQDRLDKAWDYWELLNSRKDTIEEKAGETYTDEELNFLINYQWMNKHIEKPEIFAVQYEYLLKGQRKQDPYNSGIYKQQSFLCHPIKKDVVQRIFMSTKSVVVDPDEYKYVHLKKGPLPKGWEKIDVWEDIGIKNWITMLARGNVQPELGHPFDPRIEIDDSGKQKISGGVIYIPDLVIRTSAELEEWKVSARGIEERIAEGLDIIEQLDQTILTTEDEQTKEIFIEMRKRAVWEHFPKNTQSCHNFFGRDCVFTFHCHEFVNIDEAILAGVLENRIPHHELELKNHAEKGYIESPNTESEP